MGEFVGVQTLKGLQKAAAAYGGGPAVNPVAIRVGDGGGAPITPTREMIDLVHRVGDAYPIIASGRDATDAAMWRFRAVIPASAGPFDVREIGLFDAAGDMLAIAKHVLVEKRTPAQGAALELETDIIVPFAETAQIVVTIAPDALISTNREMRAGWMTVDSATLAAPPANPVTGATYLVPAGATGAWNGLAGQIAQWIGSMWVSASAPEGHRVNDRSKAESDPLRELKYIGGAWVSAGATSTAYGVTRLASADEAEAGVADDVALTPKRQRATMIVDAAVTFTVYGPGADFVDLNAADRWLSYRRITKTGFVTLSLAAGKWINTLTQNLSHPNGDRIEIVGGAMVGAFPAYGDLTLTGSSAGQRAADTLANLALCRARWTTELRFTGGAMLGFASPIGRLARVLVTCDGSPADGLYVVGNQRLEQVAVTGAGKRGLASVSGSQVYDRVLSFGNAQHGVLVGDAGQISVVTAAIAVSNGDSGLRAEAAVLRQATGVIYGSCNAGSGVLAADGGRIIAGAGSYANLNASYGWIAQSGGYIGADASVANGNLGGPYYATGASRIAAVGATASGGTSVAYDNSSIRATGAAIGTLSPAANTVGNYNSFITV